MHTPLNVTEDALKSFTSANVARIIFNDRGSTDELAKAINIQPRLPHIFLINTFASSEKTAILCETNMHESDTVSAC